MASDLDRTLAALADPTRRGVIDLLRMKAELAGGEAEIPAELAAAARDARQQLIETAAECDDALLEKYLEEGALADDQILRGLVAGTRSRSIVPLLCGSATQTRGVAALLWAVTELLPPACSSQNTDWPALLCPSTYGSPS